MKPKDEDPEERRPGRDEICRRRMQYRMLDGTERWVSAS